MKTVEIGGRVFLVPENYQEASESQRLVFVMAGVVTVEKRDRVFWEWLVMHGLGCGQRFWKKLSLSHNQWFALMSVFEWVFSAKCEVRPCASFELKGVRYYLPAAGLDDTDAVDFSVAANWLMALGKGDEEAVDMLMGVLCREKRADLAVFKASDGWDGDVREVYNEQRSMDRATEFKGLEIGLKLAFVQWWEFEFRGFVEDYDALFGAGKEEPRYADGRGWLMVLKYVAQKGYLGKLADVHGMNVHEVWSYMLDDAMDNAPSP